MNKEALDEYFEKSSEKIKGFLSSSDFDAFITEQAQKFNLDAEKKDILEGQLILFLIGAASQEEVLYQMNQDYTDMPSSSKAKLYESVVALQKNLSREPEPEKELVQEPKPEIAKKLFDLGNQYQLHLDVIGKISEIIQSLSQNKSADSVTEEIKQVVQGLVPDENKFIQDLNNTILKPIQTTIISPETPKSNVVEQKLSMFTQSKRVVSDQSTPKLSSKETDKGLDPYREPVS